MSKYPGRYDGEPGLVWYSSVEKVLGAKLKVGNWLDTLDHRGARRIESIDKDDPSSPLRYVRFSGGDGETVRKGIEYDVVDPNSQVEPDGTPM